MIQRLVLCILTISAADAAKITMNNAGSVEVTSSTIFTDTDVKVFLASPRECCVGASCDQYSELILTNPTNKQLKVALDSYEYEVESNIQIIHSANLISIADTPMRSCFKETGGFPAIGTGQTNLTASNIYLGIDIAYLDVANWRMVLRSKDGNLICENGTLINPNNTLEDLIFFDGFDNIIFKNGFEQE